MRPMNHKLVDNINATVGEDDHLFVMGDVTFEKGGKKTSYLF